MIDSAADVENTEVRRVGTAARADGRGRACHLPELPHAMKARHLVCYDLGEPERWQRVHKIMKGAGTRVQYSVLRCDLADREGLVSEQDQLLIIDLGPCDGRAARCGRSLGRPYKPPEYGPVIV